MKVMPHRRSSPDRVRGPRAYWTATLALLLACGAAADAQQVVPAPALVAEPERVPLISDTTAPAPATEAAAPAGGDCRADGFDWTKVPPVTPLPRLGWFPMPPTGPGYYSLKDVLTDNWREAPPKVPYPPVSPTVGSFFDADYRYLDDPKNTQHGFFDPVKRIHLGDNWLLSLGGEERFRYMNEVDARLTGIDDTYYLLRSRVYGDLWYKDVFRVYVEYLDAQSWDNDLVPRPIDVDHSDLLNLFFDLKVFQLNDHPVYVRAGRQELLYGSERLISPLDWANTRRTFEGVKAFYRGDKFDVDAFWVKPVVVSPGHFDAADANRNFAGLWTTYKPKKGTTVDFYYLYLDQTTPVVAASTGRRGFDVSTFGMRYAGDNNNVLWDFEGMYQFGDFADRDISAGAFTAGLGYHFKGAPLNPVFWLYNDWASGDHTGHTSGAFGTFNQLFPFGHYYFGWLDLVGRQNIEDLNMQLQLNPVNWIVLTAQAHFFWLDSAKDALYNAAGAVQRIDPTGRAGYHVGNELDLVANFHLTQHQDIFVGYSHLYAGEFIQRTGNPHSPDLFYFQYSFKW
jgi:hypothetical protein